MFLKRECCFSKLKVYLLVHYYVLLIIIFLLSFEFIDVVCLSDSNTAHDVNLMEDEYVSSNLTNIQFNITVPINKQVKLPCFIENGRKFIWMHANRDEILAIENIIISSDRRFYVETTSKCSSRKNNEIMIDDSKVNLKTNNNSYLNSNSNENNINEYQFGCWVNLVINRVNLNDEGMYLCQIDTMFSSKVFLNILVPPFLKKFSYSNNYLNQYNYEHKNEQNLDTSISVNEGKSIDLTCDAYGRPTPVIKWYSITGSNSTSTFIRNSSILKLKNLNRNSIKKYECVAENGVNPSLSRTFTIDILFLPVIKNLEIDDFKVAGKKENENNTYEVALLCKVQSNPKPLIKWFYNQIEINKNNSFSYQILDTNRNQINYHSRLLIKNFKINQNFNLFECVVENKIGMVNLSILVYSDQLDGKNNLINQTDINLELKKTIEKNFYKNKKQLKTVYNLEKNLVFKEYFFIDKKRTILLDNIKKDKQKSNKTSENFSFIPLNNSLNLASSFYNCISIIALIFLIDLKIFN